MKKKSLLIGNDINNINPTFSWEDLINDIAIFCGINDTDLHNKPFPLLYEEIFLKSVKEKSIDEKMLKNYISEKVSAIEGNSIHSRIINFETENIITTNYEFTLEGTIPVNNLGIIEEPIYSIFRHYGIKQKKYWHIHGDCRVPTSINLGFEHYIGQTQRIRNYVVNGPRYANELIPKKSLISRIREDNLSGQSWIELFFTSDIYIFGLSLDFVETDLWWLLTYRSRQLFYKKNENIKNKIYYFIPDEYILASKQKIDLLIANGVTVIDTISGTNKLDYYNNVLNTIETIDQ